MKYTLILLSAFLLACSGNKPSEQGTAVTGDTTTVVASGKEKAADPPTEFFDKSKYTVLDSATGDLNLDEFPDKLLILKSKDEGTLTEVARPLLLLSGKADGSFVLAARNDSVVLCADCGGVFGDPYSGITIKNGYFSIEHYGGSSWRWTRIITFKYSKEKGEWILHRDAGESFHTSDPEKTEAIVTNKKDFDKLPFKDFNYNKE